MVAFGSLLGIPQRKLIFLEFLIAESTRQKQVFPRVRQPVIAWFAECIVLSKPSLRPQVFDITIVYGSNFGFAKRALFVLTRKQGLFNRCRSIDVAVERKLFDAGNIVVRTPIVRVLKSKRFA